MPTALSHFGATGVTRENAVYSFPRSGWDGGTLPVSIRGSNWKTELASDGLSIGDQLSGDSLAAEMYVTNYGNIQSNGSRHRINVELMGSMDAMSSGFAKLRRTNIDGAVDSVTVETPAIVYTTEERQNYVYDGTNWVNAYSGGIYAGGQLNEKTFADISSIGISVVGASGFAQGGGRIRLFTPRASFQDQFITDTQSFTQTQRTASLVILGWGTLVTTPTAGTQNLGNTHPSQTPFDTANLPSFTVASSLPKEYDGLQLPFGWVLTNRTVEPLLYSSGPLWLVTDSYTFYADKEFM